MDSELHSRLAAALSPAYELGGEIGRGGMAIVYRARDTRLKRAVAVKLLPPELAFRPDIKTRFLREAEMAARLSHPNIVPIYSVDDCDGFVYFVMALVDGGSVGERLRALGVYPVDDARRVLREVADALAYAHARGVIHRDIKPDNILLDRDSGRAMVTDFGIARAASDDDSGGTRLTATGVAIGTPAYMSPEQCAGDRAIDGRSDLYSLGAVAYQMLAGEPPFSGGNTPSIMVKHVTEAPVPLRRKRPDVPEDLERIIMRLLAKEPAGRFADGAALVAALDGAPVTPLPAPRRASRGTLPPPPTPATRATDVANALAGIVTSVDRLRDLKRVKRAEQQSLPARMRHLRRSVASWATTSAGLFAINYLTGGPHAYWWCLWAIIPMGLSVVGHAGKLWSDGVPIDALLSGTLPPELAARPEPRPATLPVERADDPYAAVLRQAMADRETLHDLIARMSSTEMQMLPDVQPTADALLARVVSLNAALRRLEPQLSANSDELAKTHARLLAQHETAGLVLRNLTLDVMRARSSGLEVALGGITSATQQARALSREIGYVLSAADELRSIES